MMLTDDRKHAIVPLDDLIELLDYAQPDEEADYERWLHDEGVEPGSATDEFHIVHAIRRLREAAT